MFTYFNKLQYTVRVNRSDPLCTRPLQAVIGRRWTRYPS